MVAIVGSLLGVLVGSYLARTTSERDWLRERRTDAYLNALDCIDAMINLARGDRFRLKFKKPG